MSKKNESLNAKTTHTTSRKRPIGLVSDIDIQTNYPSSVSHFVTVGGDIYIIWGNVDVSRDVEDDVKPNVSTSGPAMAQGYDARTLYAQPSKK